MLGSLGMDRQDPKTRKAAVLLSSLVLTPDAALEAFRQRRVGDPALDPEQLKRARDVLDAVGNALVGKDAARWRRIAEAWRLLERDAHEAPEEASEPAPANPPVAPAPAPQPAPRPKPPSHPQHPAPRQPPPLESGPPSRPALRGTPSPWLSQSQQPVATAPAPMPVVPSVLAAPVLDTTLPVDGERADVGIALPFVEGPAVPPPPAALAEPLESVGETAFFAGPLVEDALPFDGERTAQRQPPAPATSELTLEQYASLRAELAARPANAAAVRARYGLRSEVECSALDRGWEARFAAEPALRARFEQYLEHYRRWLSSQR